MMSIPLAPRYAASHPNTLLANAEEVLRWKVSEGLDGNTTSWLGHGGVLASRSLLSAAIVVLLGVLLLVLGR